ncbi:hypothetical protein [Lentzea aerocolonigenes]|nr:hypothetical protein [Lentzea aerocolonigenes]
MKILIAALAALAFALTPFATQEAPAQNPGWCSDQSVGAGPCT